MRDRKYLILRSAEIGHIHLCCPDINLVGLTVFFGPNFGNRRMTGQDWNPPLFHQRHCTALHHILTRLLMHANARCIRLLLLMRLRMTRNVCDWGFRWRFRMMPVELGYRWYWSLHRTIFAVISWIAALKIVYDPSQVCYKGQRSFHLVGQIVRPFTSTPHHIHSHWRLKRSDLINFIGNYCERLVRDSLTIFGRDSSS